MWQCSFDHWSWLGLRTETINNSFSGITIGVFFAFIVIVIMTGNLQVALISTFSILTIIIFMFGCIKHFSWEFGVVEATCVVVFIGLSVDYVVHICHQYTHCF